MSDDWQLLLEQKGDLSICQGSREAVADAVRRGADLRLYMTTDQYEETIYFQQTYVGEGTRFAGLMSHHHGYVHHGKAVMQPNLSVFKYDTYGKFSQIKWLWGDIALDEGQAYPYGIYRWFACDRWRVIYEHDAAGKPIQGSLDELMGHVRSGRTIQVGIRDLFGLWDDRTDGPAHISYPATIQPLIRNGSVESNCDMVVVGAPQWPFGWAQGVHVGFIKPATTGILTCFLAEPGYLPFTRFERQRSIIWMVADSA